MELFINSILQDENSNTERSKSESQPLGSLWSPGGSAIPTNAILERLDRGLGEPAGCQCCI